jgi:hypothetical protein
MFETIAQAAEQAVTRVSRRAFVGKLGRGALAVAGALAGRLVFASDVQVSRGKCCCGLFGGDVLDCYRRPKGNSQCEEGYSPCRCTKACA